MVVDHYGKLDIPINDAGMSSGGSEVTIDTTLWDRVIATDLNSVMLMSRFSIPHLGSAGGGSIVNVSSVAAMRRFGTSIGGSSSSGRTSDDGHAKLPIGGHQFSPRTAT